jgi:methionine-rich copper-binding protein CopC
MQKQIILFALGLLSLLATPVRVDAHALILRAEPRVGSRVKKVPDEVRIYFSEPVQAGMSSIQVFDEHGKQVDKKDAHLDRNNPVLVCVSLRPGLERGTYHVIWRVRSVDTHATNGDFRFQVVP